MIIRILISIVLYFILMYLSVNLLGLFVRGLFSNPEMDKLKTEGYDFIKREIENFQRADKRLNIVALVLIIVYLYLLFHFWNIGVMSVAILIMTGRLPDLIWEIKNGKKITSTIASTLPKDALYYMSAFLPWLGLPLLYYSLYNFK